MKIICLLTMLVVAICTTEAQVVLHQPICLALYPEKPFMSAIDAYEQTKGDSSILRPGKLLFERMKMHPEEIPDEWIHRLTKGSYVIFLGDDAVSIEAEEIGVFIRKALALRYTGENKQFIPDFFPIQGWTGGEVDAYPFYTSDFIVAEYR